MSDMTLQEALDWASSRNRRIAELEASIESKSDIINLLYNQIESMEKHRCDHCGANIIDNCPRCGAPQCCPQCCRIAALEAENERLRDDIKTQNKMLNEQVAIMADLNGEAKELQAQRQEDADLIEAQKREIEVLHGIRDEAERLRAEVEQLQWVIRDMSNAMEGE